MTKFLVPMDFSKEAYLALDWTGKLASQMRESQIYLLTIGPVSAEPAKEAALREQLQREVVMLRQNLQEKASLFGFYRSGHIPEEIRDFCRTEGMDLVVMTTRGRFGAARQLEGSTTEETVRLVPCPILVLHLNQITVDAAQKRFEGFLPGQNEKPAL